MKLSTIMLNMILVDVTFSVYGFFFRISICSYVNSLLVICIYLAFFYYITSASCFPSICHDFAVYTLEFSHFHLSAKWVCHYFVCPLYGVQFKKMSSNVPKCPEMSWYVLKCPTHVQGLTWYHVSCEKIWKHQSIKRLVLFYCACRGTA